MGSIAKLEAFKLACMEGTGEIEFDRYSSIYIAPTSNVKGIINCYDDFSSILTVGSCGGIPFEALLKGAKKVDCFDKNELQKYYFELALNSIFCFKYEDFCRYFSLDYDKLLHPDFYHTIENKLSSEAREIWKMLFDIFGIDRLINSKLLRTSFRVDLEYLKRFCSYYNEESYNKLQKILRSGEVEINYDICDVSELLSRYIGNKYDLILLDNIFQYYTEIDRLCSSDLIDKFVKNDLVQLLNDDGHIQVNYAFEIATHAVKDKIGMTIDKDVIDQILFGEELLKYERKSGVNIPLIEKGGYRFDFIEGVENEKNHPASNMVLTYSLKK